MVRDTTVYQTNTTLLYSVYSLFHQILGVAFFQFTRSLFKIFQQNFSRIIFIHLPPASLKIWLIFLKYYRS